MNFFERMIEFLRFEMEKPEPYGIFHIISLLIIIALVFVIAGTKKNASDHGLRLVLGTYGFVSLILEIIKQLLFSTELDAATGNMIWDYQLYAFPFQFCSTPMYAACIACFMKDCKVRRALISYMSFFTILGSFMVMMIPTTIFTETTLINIHTTFLHAGGLVVSMFLIIHGHVKIEFKTVLSGLIVYAICVILANTLNVVVYESGILNGESFDMFFLSPYFENDMPVFSIIEDYVHPILYIGIYIFAFLLGASIVYSISKGIAALSSKVRHLIYSHAN